MGDEPTPHARIYLTPPCCGNYEHGEVTWCEDAANECGNCGAQPTEYLHSALAPIRAAEILAAERERDALREALLNALASLVAATSLLERGGKKAAPSDKMFAQMLVDYNKSAAAARAALTANHSEHGEGK